MYQKSVLPNGLRVITSSMPETRSVSTMAFIGAGSVYENEEEAGLSHFAEHLLFKGTTRRPTSKEISEAIEGVGGMLNGGTSKELTVYWSKVARPHFPCALDLMVDMLLHSRFDAQEVERERQIIIEELNESMDSPQQRVNMLIDSVVWPDQPLGRDVIGSKESLVGLSRDMLLEYTRRQYVPNNAVISVAGDICHKEILSSVAAAFGDWLQGSPRSHYHTQETQKEPRVKIEYRDIEQAHICLALCGLPVMHPERFNLDLLNVVLGEGMSSRLFLEVREKRGLSYDIHSYTEHFLDSGTVTVCAGVDPKQVEGTVTAILEQLHLIKDGVPDAELSKAKEYTKGRLLLRMEDTRNVASWIGGQELLIGRVYTVDDVVSVVDAIGSDDIRRVARQLMVPERLNLAIVGPVKGEDRLCQILGQ